MTTTHHRVAGIIGITLLATSAYRIAWEFDATPPQVISRVMHPLSAPAVTDPSHDARIGAPVPLPACVGEDIPKDVPCRFDVGAGDPFIVLPVDEWTQVRVYDNGQVFFIALD